MHWLSFSLAHYGIVAGAESLRHRRQNYSDAAANTGLTEGSTPNGNDYDRDS